MDERNDNQPGMSLSPDASAYPPVPALPPVQPMSTPVAAAGPMPQPQAGQAQPVGAPTQVWLPPTVPVEPAAGEPADQAGAVPQTAQDADLIEKEWVLHAKEIIGRTRQDPYAQTAELQKLKTEYLQKRYNRSLEKAD